MAAAEDGGGLADRLVEVVTSLEGVADSVVGMVSSLEGVGDMAASLESAGESLNSTVTRLLDLGPGALPPPAVLSLASVIGEEATPQRICHLNRRSACHLDQVYRQAWQCWCRRP